ncbi:hypothetical protein L6164_013051 [Bauhinia variegata]|uniref:Uncharacterized protein n=1 Tax=Bauhinia variegata TaxID=167791 RepID=A0ACB9PBF2_BAUVA|nr:hypothetical protein L6164_013051 [Bauhinia variegata]
MSKTSSPRAEQRRALGFCSVSSIGHLKRIKKIETKENDLVENDSEPKNLVDSVRLKIDELLKPKVREQCIYRAPLKVRRINEIAYTPRVISIGPFHLRDERLQSMKSMQQLKLIYLKSFLEGTGLTLADCVSKIQEWEADIRNCYAENIQPESDDFVEMVLIDACFIIELFFRYYDAKQWTGTDPLFAKLAEDVAHDLILLENQLPYFVLDGLYNLATKSDPTFPSFLNISFKYFEKLNPQNIYLME